MPTIVHSILIDSTDAIAHVVLPIGMLSKDVRKDRNKDNIKESFEYKTLLMF